jgi:TDG/mug DNA glycosylase family protein
LQPRKSSFAPVVTPATRLLILGSLPGEQSLARAQYYGNPRNQFWVLMGVVLDVDLAPLPYSERLAVLAGHHVGLWDVIASAVRPGSLDAAIRESEANDLLSLAGSLPDLRAVAFNGGKAADLGRRHLGDGGPFSLVTLPSSSPAYTLPLAAKQEAWLALRAFL